MYMFLNIFFLLFSGKNNSNSSNSTTVQQQQQQQSKKVIANKTAQIPVVVKQEFAGSSSNNKQQRLNNNIPSHLQDVPKKLPSAKKSPPPEIKSENGIKIEGKSSVIFYNVHFCKVGILINHEG